MTAFLLPLLPILGEIAKQLAISYAIGILTKWAAILVGILIISYTLYKNW